MPTLDKELKKAILRLPEAEKDKLLLRLVAKDADLVERLQFVLIEEETTTEERRLAVRETIIRTAGGHYSSPDGWLLKAIRSLNLAITHHVKITKDRYGEVELNLCLINSFAQQQAGHFERLNRHNERVSAYMAKKAESVLKKIRKLDADYYIEFESEIQKMLQFVNQHSPSTLARELGLPRTWNAG